MSIRGFSLGVAMLVIGRRGGAAARSRRHPYAAPTARRLRITPTPAAGSAPSDGSCVGVPPVLPAPVVRYAPARRGRPLPRPLPPGPRRRPGCRPVRRRHSTGPSPRGRPAATDRRAEFAEARRLAEADPARPLRPHREPAGRRGRGPAAGFVTLVQVGKPDARKRAETDAAGRFSVELTPGTWVVYVEDAAGKSVEQGRLVIRERKVVRVRIAEAG